MPTLLIEDHDGNPWTELEFSEEEFSQLQDCAEEEGLSLEEFVLKVITEHVNDQKTKEQAGQLAESGEDC
jgi:hypothetical protein